MPRKDELKVFFYPDPILKRSASPVINFDDRLLDCVDAMVELMYAEGGVGLAGPQAGLNMSIIVVDPTGGESAGNLHVFANPKITWQSNDSVMMIEGCLSFPRLWTNVTRPTSVDVEYQDVKGVKQKQRFGGKISRIVQHEIDHLLGVNMVDRVGPLERKRLLKEVARASRG